MTKARTDNRGFSLDRSPEKHQHALVLGGSLAGLLAARVLSDHFVRVTVVERDRFPLTAEARRGIPQANHVHALMPRGRQIIEKLFPGIHDQMMADGAPVIDMARDIAWLTPQGWGINFKSDLEVLSFTRPLLDLHVRRRVSAIPNVKILENTEIVRLVEGEANAIAGALVRFETLNGGRVETVLNADLVVDASGRASRAPEWLKDLGYPTPEETVVNAYLGYASRFYEMPRDFSANWKCTFVQSAPPNEKRGGILFTVENNRWLVTLVGGGHDHPTKDEVAFLEFARSLRSPIIYETIKNAKPLSSIKVHRGTENRLRHFASVSSQPRNFLALGDAVCAFNPVYGQGMTIAAMGALTLDQCLIELSPNHSNLAREFYKRLAKVNAAPWMMATGEDYRYRETTGGRASLATRFMHRYMNRVVKLSTFDVTVRTVLLQAFGMLVKPSAFFRPKILGRVIVKDTLRTGVQRNRTTEPAHRQMLYKTSLERRI